MENLNYNELISINGGDDCHPTVSNDAAVQGGYGVGWHIGRALGRTIDMFKSIFE